MYVPGAMWTAARHKIPFLSVLHNNKGYHQEVMHVQRMSNRRNRVANLGTEIRDNGPVGTRIENPDVDYSKIAAGMGGGLRGRCRTRTSSAVCSRKRSRSSSPASRRWSMSSRSLADG